MDLPGYIRAIAADPNGREAQSFVRLLLFQLYTAMLRSGDAHPFVVALTSADGSAGDVRVTPAIHDPNLVRDALKGLFSADRAKHPSVFACRVEAAEGNETGIMLIGATGPLFSIGLSPDGDGIRMLQRQEAGAQPGRAAGRQGEQPMLLGSIRRLIAKLS